MSTRVPRASAVIAGLALIVLPPLAVLLKLSVFPGWMMVLAIWSSPLLLIGYAVQVVIAANALLRSRGVFSRTAAARRGLIAAWLTSIGVLAAAFFLVDGGDDGRYGSAFTELLGTSSTGTGETLSMQFFAVCAALWLGGWLWLLFEWIVRLVKSRSARRWAGA
ncbi:hypothetical protein [Microbacterium sp.]|uniref:hypothetical protein n=1 Tax=Microbacterium sp. TaxID=51671 RepID=UPI0028119F7F|nr:hypothetical protein [Microbacterium sp.]